jgi:septum formation protein
MKTAVLHLASASPRRQALLAALGLRFTAAGVDVDESRRPGESPAAMVLRLAAAKAQAAGAATGTVVIGADTAVVLGDEVFGKPAGQGEAEAMLASLSGRTHQVLTGIAVRSRGGVETALSTSDVRFRDIGPDEATAYWHSGEPADKAGAYAIQGRGGVFVAAMAGSYSGVVGLPVYETAVLLRNAGIDVLGSLPPGDKQHR